MDKVIQISVLNQPHLSSDFKVQHPTSFDDVHLQIKNWLSKANPTYNDVIIVDELDPWKEIRDICNSNTPSKLLAIPLPLQQHSIQSTETDILSPQNSFTTLRHFINQHETKSNYFLNNPSYKAKLQTEFDYLLHTFQADLPSHTLLEAIVNKVETLLKSHQLPSHEIMLHKWILDITSMSPQLNSTTTHHLKHLSRLVFDRILHS